MADSPQRFVLISRAGIDVDSNAGEGAWEGFGRDSEAIWEGSDLVKLGRVLKLAVIRDMFAP